MKGTITYRFYLAAFLILSMQSAFAQDIHFTQFDASPLTINPAFTGMFDGRIRACGIYRNQWKSVTIPFVTMGASVDMPLLIEPNGDYLATGLQLFKDKAGDGNLTNFSGMASVAYHKFFGTTYYGKQIHGSDLAVGLQAGYCQKSVDISKLYFADEYYDGTFIPGVSNVYHNGIGNSINYYIVNAGISFSQSLGEKVSYTVGVAGNNLNQPNAALAKKLNLESALDMRITGQLGINWVASQRLTLRPAVLYQMQSSANELIAGNEFHFSVGNNPDYDNYSTAVFAGLWYRTADAVMVTAGVEFKGFRIGLGYDYNVSSLNATSNGNGGFEIALKYVQPSAILFSNKRTIPCGRF